MLRHWIVALVLLAPVAIVRADEPKAGDLPPELSWVPPDAAAFVHVRLGAFWNGPGGAAVRDKLKADDPTAIERVERALGVRLNQIDRLTLIVPKAAGGAPEESVVVRVTTMAPYERTAVLELLGVKRSPLGTMAQLPASGGMVRFTDAKNLTFAFSRNRTVALLAQAEKRGEAGRLVPALKLAAQNHFLVAGADVSVARELPWLAGDSSLRPFFIARTAIFVGDLSPNGIDFSLRVTTGLRGHADEVAEALEARRGDALKTIERTRAALNPKLDPGMARLLDALAAAVKGARLERKDREVIVSGALNSIEPLAVLAVDAVDAVQCAADRAVSVNNLKQMGLAMHNYHDVNGHLPAAVLGKDGKPILSWRVAVLPYIEQDQLYKQFKLEEPWDSEHNKKLLARMPKIYELPGNRKKYEVPSTYYRIFVGNGAMFDFRGKTNLASITDGTSNTIMIVEAADAVPWTKPEEIEYDPKKTPKLGYHYGGRANVVAGDGAVHTLRRSFNEQMLHYLIQRADGNPVTFDE
jgi:hypothetical protein